MPLPEFNANGDLPLGIHRVHIATIVHRFGSAAGTRARCTVRLAHLHDLAQRTGHLLRCVVFGSYVTAKSEPNDVDLILVMDDDFRLAECPIESRALFDHPIAQARYGASIFWIRPGLLIGETVDQFIAYWQTKRDGSRRGIVEIIT